MARIVFRSIIISFPRFAAIIALVIFTQRFEVSPLPDWTLVVFAYFMHAAITYVAARWTFRGHAPEAREAWVAIALFVFLELFYESALYLALSDFFWRGLPSNFRWQTVWLFILYAFAVLAAAHGARKTKIEKTLPEGMEM